MEAQRVPLSPPRKIGTVPLEAAIKTRKSVRSYARRPLTLPQLSQILWAGQGLREGGYRVTPSAGATYPLELFVVIGRGGVENLMEGVYCYDATQHHLLLLASGDFRQRLGKACLSQTFIKAAPVSIVIVAEYSRVTGRYGERGVRYALIEVGHVAQNISLQSVALGLSCVMVGAFDDADTSAALNLPQSCEPLYVIPLGYAKHEG